MNQFSLCDNVLMHAQRVVVSAALQKYVLCEFPLEHTRVSRMKSVMRGYVYWPTMDCDMDCNW